jgi:DNA-directed RNA polymerase subunit RPC12/RpoP
MSPEPQTAGAENSGPASFRCLHCGKSIAIDVIPGTRTECPECHKPITVPAPYELRRPKKSKNKRALIYLVLLVSIPVGIYLFYNVTLWDTYRGKPMEYWFERMKKHDCKGLAKFGCRAVPQILSVLESCERKPVQTTVEGVWDLDRTDSFTTDMLQASALITLSQMGSEAAPAADYLLQLLEGLPYSTYTNMHTSVLTLALTNLAKTDYPTAQRLGQLAADTEKDMRLSQNRDTC